MEKYQFDDYTLDNISNLRSRKDQIKELKNYEYHHPDNAILGFELILKYFINFIFS